jgi:hypothetical protein
MGCLVSAEVECIQCSLFKKVIKPPLNIIQLYQCNFDTEYGKIHIQEGPCLMQILFLGKSRISQISHYPTIWLTHFRAKLIHYSNFFLY